MVQFLKIVVPIHANSVLNIGIKKIHDFGMGRGASVTFVIVPTVV